MNFTDMFQVESIEKSQTPDDRDAGDWCRYVVANRRSRIVGRFRGTPAQARRNAEQLASSVNERMVSGRAAGTQRPQSRGKPASAQSATNKTRRG
jgi:hypothetical protein